MDRFVRSSAVLVVLMVIVSSFAVLLIKVDDNPVLTATITHRDNYGDCVLDVSVTDFINEGFEVWDIVEVSGTGFSGDAIIVSGYHGVMAMELFVNFSLKSDEVEISCEFIEDDFYIGETLTFTFLKESGRDDDFPRYSEGTCQRQEWMSDADYANFRCVTTTGIAPGVLYRSSNPFAGNDRSDCVNDLIEEAGVKRLVVMCSTDEEIYASIASGKVTEDFATMLFDTKTVFADFMSVKFLQDDSYADVFQYIADNEGPYDICCSLGKDRTGFVIYVLEALMGASLEELEDDYRQSYVNLYDIKEDSAEYDNLYSMLEPTIIVLHDMSLLDHIWDVDWTGYDIGSFDLKADAERFLTDELGLSTDSVDSIRAHLSGQS